MISKTFHGDSAGDALIQCREGMKNKSDKAHLN